MRGHADKPNQTNSKQEQGAIKKNRMRTDLDVHTVSDWLTRDAVSALGRVRDRDLLVNIVNAQR